MISSSALDELHFSKNMGDKLFAYSDSGQGARRIAAIFRRCFIGADLILVVTCIFFAGGDQGWGALWIAMVASPIASVILMIAGLIAAFIIKRCHPLVRWYSLLSCILSVPPVGAGITLASIWLMPLHGC